MDTKRKDRAAEVRTRHKRDWLAFSALTLAIAYALPGMALADNYPVNSASDFTNAVNTANSLTGVSSTITLGSDITMPAGLNNLPTLHNPLTIDTGSNALNASLNFGSAGGEPLTINGILNGNAGNPAIDTHTVAALSSTIINNANVTGGANNTGSAAVVLFGTVFTNSGSITGGAGTGATQGSVGVQVRTNSSLTNEGTIQGGASQSGVAGAGVDIGIPSGSETLINHGTIKGGDSTTGVGGLGLFIRAGTQPIVNTGTIAGGNGQSAITSNAAWTLTNSGTITAGAGQANAILTTGTGALTLELQAGYAITGNVLGSATATTDTLRLGGTTDATFDISSVGSSAQYQNFEQFQKTGASTWTLVGDGTASTPWTIQQGTLQLGNGGTSGSFIGDVTNNGVLAFNRSDALTFGNAIGGTGAVSQLGSGTTILVGTNTYGGDTTITSGTLQIGNGGTAGTLGTGAVTDNAILAFDRSDTLTVSGGIAGSGMVNQIGTGTTVLTGANTYTGDTTISNGTLALSGGGSVATSSVVTNNGIFDVSGTSGTSITSLAGNGTVNLGSQTLTLTHAADTFAGTLGGTGGLTFAGGTETLTGTSSNVGAVTVNGGTLQFGQAGSFHAVSLSTNSGATTAIGSHGVVALSGALTQNTGSTLSVMLGSPTQPAVTAATASLGGTLNVAGFSATAPTSASALPSTQFVVVQTMGGITGDFANVTIGGSTSPVDYLKVSGHVNGDAYDVGYALTWLTGPASGNGTFTLANATDAFDVDVALGNQAGTFISGWDGKSLTKAGAGTLTLSQDNSFTGATVISGGTLALSGAGSIAASSGVMDNGTFDISKTTRGASIASLAGNGTVDLGSQTLTLTHAADTFAGIIDGAGGLTLAGGTETLTGMNSFSGATTISGGTLQIGNGGTMGTLGTGAVIDNAILAFDRSDTVMVSGGIAGTGMVNQIGRGTLILNGVNTYTGGTTVQAGTLEVGDSAHTSASIQSNVAVDAGAMLRGHGTISGDVTSDGTVWPGGSVGVLTINGNYTQNADATLQIDVTPTQASELLVNGNVSLAGKLTLIYAPGTYSPGTYTLVQAKALSGQFAATTSTGSVPTLLNPTVTYSSTQADLVLKPTVVTPNEGSLYGNLIRTVNLFGQQTLSTVLDATLRSSMLGVAQGSSDTGCHGANVAHANTVTSSCKSDLWMQYSGGNDSLSGSNGLNSTVFGLQGGFDHAVSDVAHLGVEAGFDRINGNDRNGGNGRVDNVHGGAYAYASIGPLVVSGMIDQAHSNYDVYRQTGVGRAEARPNGDTTAGALQATWPITATQWQVTPAIGALYQHQSVDTSSESIPGSNPLATAFALQTSRSNYTTLQPYARVLFSWPFVAQGISYVPQLDAGYFYDTRNNHTPAVQAVSQDGTAFMLPGSALGRGMATVGARITAQAGASWALYLDYRGQFSSHLNGNALSMGFTKRF